MTVKRCAALAVMALFSAALLPAALFAAALVLIASAANSLWRWAVLWGTFHGDRAAMAKEEWRES